MNGRFTLSSGVISRQSKQVKYVEYIKGVNSYYSKIRDLQVQRLRHEHYRTSSDRKIKVAVIFFGLTRTLSKTIDSIRTRLFKRLTNYSIDYDVFIHTYKINGKYENQWTKERTDTYTNEDVDQLLRPKYSLNDDQDSIIQQINFEEYYTKLGNWTGLSSNLTKYLIRNMCLALYSKKRIIEVFEQHKDEYDYCIITRPDLKFNADLNINWFRELNSNNIIIPVREGFHGCNDRFCMSKPDVAIYYGKLFDQLKTYSCKKSIISERYLKDMLGYKGIRVKKKNIDYTTIRLK